MTFLFLKRHFYRNGLKQYALFFFVQFLSVSGYLQAPKYTNYTVDDGLASNETYEVFEDKKGQIWVATDHGISIYNGYEFKNITVNEGLPDNTIFGFFEDDQERIWLRSFNGVLSYIKNDTIYKVLPHKEFGHIVSLYVDKGDTVWFSTLNQQHKVFKLSNGEYTSKLLESYYYVRQIDTCKKGVLTGVYNHRISNYYLLNGNRYLLDSNNSLSLTLHNRNPSAINYATNEIWVNFDSDIMALQPDTVKQILNTNQKNLVFQFSRDGEMLLGTNSGSMITNKLKNTDYRLLQGLNVCSIIKDREGGYWMATNTNGIFYTPNLEVNAFELGPDSRISAITKNQEGELIAIGHYLNTYKIDSTQLRKVFHDSLNRYEYWSHSVNELGEIEVYCTNTNTININTGKITESWNKGYNYILGEDHFVHIIGNRLHILTPETKDTLNTVTFPNRIGILKPFQHNNQLYIPTLKGLYKYDSENGLTSMGNKYPLLSRRVNVCYTDGSGRLWIGSNEYGIFLLDGEKLISIHQINPETGVICRNLMISNEFAWASTEKGLIKINLLDYEDIQIFTVKDGLLSNGIRCIYPDTAFILLGHEDGITKFPIDHEKKEIYPPIYVDEIRINNDLCTKQTSYQLNHNENHIKISFTGISYSSKLSYKYRLKSSTDSSWQYTSNRNVEFLSVPPGKYLFEVMAVNASGHESIRPRAIRFTIDPPFWKTWWFYSLSVIIIFALTYFYIHNRLKKVRAKVKLERKLIDVEQQALRARMNPHFIFNALNSIQSFYLKNDTKSANKYLSDFSTLMRAVLEDSNKKLIPISKELSTLQSYLSIELSRVKNKFDFTINPDNNINLDHYKIPPLLLQPYVENAIWHGLMNKSGNGHIQIDLIDKGSYLLFSIQDNGIGRDRAREIKSRSKIKHQSAGLEITANRIDLVKQLYGFEFSIDFFDLKTDNIPSGTRVEIRLPYLT